MPAPKATPGAKLTTPAHRARLPRGKRFIEIVATGVALAYRRGKAAKADGTWSVRTRTGGAGSPYELARLGRADDLTAADGVQWLSHRQATAIALGKAETIEGDAKAAPLTVGEAVATYIARRKARGTGRPQEDETALANHLDGLADRRVAGLDHGQLQAFAHTAPRNACKALRAALNQTPAALRPNNVVLSALKEHRPHAKRLDRPEAVMGDGEIDAMVGGARRHDLVFGLLVEVLATTGCRPIQIERCRVGDLRPAEDILIVPASRKGNDPTKDKPVSRLPLPPALMRELVIMAEGRPDSDWLFKHPDYVKDGYGWKIVGARQWTKMDRYLDAQAAGITDTWRLYDLRHARIVRLILARVPIGAIADKLDTSVKEIERTYARWIGTETDAMFRAALPNLRRLKVVS